MAKRRDELAAYTFARKRTVAAFLAPQPGGSEEGAPRPVRTVMPSLAVGVILVIGFIAWGVIKPTAPKGWDTPGENIIVDSDSTTRYVVLQDKDTKAKTLHPVLNYASAKLLLDKGKGTVLEVPGKEIDKSDIRHGPTLGIPYAPDRLPSPEDAETAKTWAVCERPTAKTGAAAEVDRAVFVFDKEESAAVRDAGKVNRGEALYVMEPGSKLEFLIDDKGNAFRLGSKEVFANKTEMQQLRLATVGQGATPQPVSKQWLQSLNDGGTISFPAVQGVGSETKVQGLQPEASTVGTVLKAADAQGEQYYVVLPNKVAAISEFVKDLILNSPAAEQAYQGKQPKPIDAAASDIATANGGPAPSYYGEEGWPQQAPKQANATDPATGTGNNTSCSVYNGTINKDTKKPNLSAWAGKAYPKKVISDSTSAYVSSGSGLLFQQIRGTAAGGGGTYLLTDTGLRYSLPTGNDSAADKDGSQSEGSKDENEETDKARTRLGYEKVKKPAYVPQTWAEFIPKGPMLDTGSASQPQSQ
ncbi:type VII secretion protein EccB [Streptomyces sp. NPDC002851]